MDALLDRLIESPRLSLYVSRLSEVLAREKPLREHFYETMTEGTKQEFINGTTVSCPPATLKHNVVSGNLFVSLSTFVSLHKLGWVGHEKMLVSLTRNDYEPDVCFWSAAKAAAFGPDQMRFPAPDFVAEVLSDSTERTDRGVKFEDYAAHGVREYWIADPDARVLEQYVLSGDAYVLSRKTDSGLVRSEAVEGFEIPVSAVFDERANLEALRTIMAANTGEHRQ